MTNATRSETGKASQSGLAEAFRRRFLAHYEFCFPNLNSRRVSNW